MTQEHLRTPGVAALIFGLCVVLTGVVVVGGLIQVKGLGDVLSVTGSAERLITSDVIKWRGNFSRTVGQAGIASGYASMKQDLASVNSYLKSKGITDQEIVINPIMMNSVYSNNKEYGMIGNVSGYTLTQDFLVESRDVPKVENTAKDSGSLIAKGIFLSSLPVEYYYSKLADVKVEILGEAMENARLRAGSIADRSGSRVSKLKSASMGVIQITSPNSPDVSDYGYYDTSSKDKKITAVIKAAFTLK